jgi:hypothetical protein
MGIIIFILILVVLFVVFPIVGSKNEQKRRANYQVPKTAYALQYLGGLSGVQNGLVYVWRQGDTVSFVAKKDGTTRSVDLSNVLHVQFNSNIQTINTGSGRSIGGAIVGEIVAGPVGAIVGSRSKTKTKTVDNSTINIVVINDSGKQATVTFKGKQATYNKVADILGASL